MIEVTPTGRHKRLRTAPVFAALPPLRAAERALLIDWARNPAPQRRWPTLRQLAGTERLELAEALLDVLVAHGVVAVHEQFRHARWWPQQVQWLDLPRLQRVLGVASAAERAAERARLQDTLQLLVAEHPALEVVANTLLETTLAGPVRAARSELLHALARWCDEQRRGMRQDFALYARPHTKAVSDTEWKWLAQHLDLDTLGIERFAPLLWLGGNLSLRWPRGRIDLDALPFTGIPAESLATLEAADATPTDYWLIENRASFERQARRREPGSCVLWVPGRPSIAWQNAVGQLLTHAPAPARISTDADPAGIEIAITAGALWQHAGLAWQPWAMEHERLQCAKTMALNAFDRLTLERLVAQPSLPGMLRDLALAMHQLDCKAEQEGWL